MKEQKRKELDGQLCWFDNETKISNKGDENMKTNNVVQLFSGNTNKKEIKEKYNFNLDNSLTSKLKEMEELDGLDFNEIVEGYLEDFVAKFELEYRRLKLITNNGNTEEVFKGSLNEIIEYLEKNEQLYNWLIDYNDEFQNDIQLWRVKTLKGLQYQLSKVDSNEFFIKVEREVFMDLEELQSRI